MRFNFCQNQLRSNRSSIVCTFSLALFMGNCCDPSFAQQPAGQSILDRQGVVSLTPPPLNSGSSSSIPTTSTLDTELEFARDNATEKVVFPATPSSRAGVQELSPPPLPTKPVPSSPKPQSAPTQSESSGPQRKPPPPPTPLQWQVPSKVDEQNQPTPKPAQIIEPDTQVLTPELIELPRATEQSPSPISTAPEPSRAAGQVELNANPNTILRLPQVPADYVVAVNQHAGSGLIGPYQQRVSQYGGVTEDGLSTFGTAQMPSDYRPWWLDGVTGPLRSNHQTVPVSLPNLLARAADCSPAIQLAATEPHIKRTQSIVEAAQFDWQNFLSSSYDSTNDPVGNELTTGNLDDRFVQSQWGGTAGVARRNRLGGEFEISQDLGYLNNNSIFLVPSNQGSARLQINYRQPILRGAGRSYNESLILLANLEAGSAGDEFIVTLQSNLADVAQEYWELYRLRAELLQKLRLVDAAEQVLKQLEARIELDSSQRNILRTRSVLERRRAELARLDASIRNAEARLKLKVNAPELISVARTELTPTESPTTGLYPVDLADALSTALTHRRDISQVIRKIKAANVRHGVAKNELLPRLDMIVGTYVAGLDGNSDVFNSWVNQFRDGTPGLNVGFEFRLPQGNRAAKATQQRRAWELNRELYRFKNTVETAMTEVEIAVREVKTNYQEMQSRYQAMVSTGRESEYLRDRWEMLPGNEDSVIQLLEDLLDSQERLAEQEAAYSRAQSEYAISFTRLHQAMGTFCIVN